MIFFFQNRVRWVPFKLRMCLIMFLFEVFLIEIFSPKVKFLCVKYYTFLGYVWFLQSSRERKKIVKKIILSCLVLL